MGFEVVVQTPAEFDAWVAQQQVGSPLINGGGSRRHHAPADARPRRGQVERDSADGLGARRFMAGGCIGLPRDGGNADGRPGR